MLFLYAFKHTESQTSYLFGINERHFSLRIGVGNPLRIASNNKLHSICLNRFSKLRSALPRLIHGKSIALSPVQFVCYIDKRSLVTSRA